VKPFRNLAQTTTPDGSQLTLHEHDGEHFLKLNGRQLMSTTATTSELMLAELPCDGLRGRADTCVLIGGLGLGYSLRRVLELVGRHARVQVAELLPEVVAWNRDLLQHVNGALLEDRRVEVITGDVYGVIRKAGPAAYDAILLDVDNGPTSMVQKKNSRIYDRRGLGIIASALKPGGKVSFWSAVPEPAFIHDLARAGLPAEAFPAKSHERAKRAAHMIYLARRRTAAELEAFTDPPAASPSSQSPHSSPASRAHPKAANTPSRKHRPER
jgi:spermidine synthase